MGHRCIGRRAGRSVGRIGSQHDLYGAWPTQLKVLCTEYKLLQPIYRRLEFCFNIVKSESNFRPLALCDERDRIPL